jgi:hypothetical protein
VAQALLALGGTINQSDKKRKMVREDFELSGNRKSVRKPKLSAKGAEASHEVSLGTRMMAPTDEAGPRGGVISRKNRGHKMTVSEMHFSLQKWLCLKLELEEESLPEEISVDDLRKITSSMVQQFNQSELAKKNKKVK